MMLHISLPSNWQPERIWITEVLLGQFLGLEHSLTFGRDHMVRLTASGKTLTVSDSFFANQVKTTNLGQNRSLAASSLDIQLCAESIPVLFGSPGFTIDTKGDALLSLDVFGSAFFMLTRYEEWKWKEHDRHGRFPAEASSAVRLGFLNRPIVDEYVEILWAAMRRLWPGLKRKEHVGRKLISCDVDLPFDPACTSISRLCKRLAGRAYRERSLGGLTSSVHNYWSVQRGNQSSDPYWQALFWIMDVNEKAGNRVTFNFIPKPTDRDMDNAPSLDDCRMRHLLKAVHRRGHFVGIHPGYNTYCCPQLFASSVETLRRALDQEGITQHELGGRQHYLRWDVTTTARLWAANELSYDSTLSYPTTAGFRTGTCREYTMYDIIERRPLSLQQRPLIVMENAVIDEANMGLGRGERALAAMQRYKEICSQFHGDFTLLWHNSSLTEEADRTMYSNLIQ
jgi:hypothetical protein